MNYKECKIILWPTNDKLGSIKMNKITNEMYGPNIAISNTLAYKFHVYICIEESANADDWVYSYKYNNIMTYNELIQRDKEPKSYYKVIATTNKSLGVFKIAQSFINEFVELNGNINRIYVEYLEYDSTKLNLYNNTVFIHKIKDDFSFDEVVNILLRYNYSIGEYNVSKKNCIEWLIKKYINHERD